MRVTSVLFAASLTAISVQAAVVPETTQINDFCNRADQPCGKLKRAADDALRILFERSPEPEAYKDPQYYNPIGYKPAYHWEHKCHLAGQGCVKAKRAADAMAETIAVVYPEADLKKYNPAYGTQKAKRDVEPEPTSEPEPIAEVTEFCHSEGQPCDRVKRAAAAIADALAEPEPYKDPQYYNPVGYHPAYHWEHKCHLAGQGCVKAKRAGDDLQAAVNRILEDVPSV